MADAVSVHRRRVHELELRVRELQQLFNSLDPAPFLNKDLDRSVEAFIENWALSLPPDGRLHLTIHVEQLDSPQAASELMADAIHNYYHYKANLVRGELRQLLRQARTSLLIGLVFVSVCLFGADLIGNHGSGTGATIARESLTIIGWVAMWRPIQMLLYDWWPLRGRIQVFENLRFARVSLVPAR